MRVVLPMPSRCLVCARALPRRSPSLTSFSDTTKKEKFLHDVCSSDPTIAAPAGVALCEGFLRWVLSAPTTRFRPEH